MLRLATWYVTGTCEQGVNGLAAAKKRIADTVFGLPHGVFGPLSSPARRDYAQVLLHLYRHHLSNSILDGLDLRRGDMVAFLADALSAVVPSEFTLGSHNAGITADAHLVYRNLVDAGWFIERAVGSETLVVIVRSVMELLRSLDTIERGASVNFTGSLQTIDVALRAIGEDPAGRAMMLAVSAQQAEDFMGRMLAVSSDIRANEGHIVSQSGFGDMMAAFFDDFVAHLVSDYKAMKSRYNPLRHAASIVSVANLYSDDDAIVMALARGYVACGYALDVDAAAAAVRAHLVTVAGVLSRAQHVVDDIDAVRLRVEERIARAVRFVDASAAAQVRGIEEAMRLLGGMDDALIEVVGLPQCGLMTDDFPIDRASLASPRSRRAPVASVGVDVAEHDETLADLARARARYAEEMMPTPERIEDYVERHLGTSSSMSLADFTVQSPREMLLLAAVRSVMANPEAAVRERYGIVFTGGSVDGVWSEYADGVLYRIGSRDDPSGEPMRQGIQQEELA